MDRSKFDLAIIPWPHVSAGDTREAVQRLRAARSIDRKLVVMPGGYGYYFFRDWMIRSGDFRTWVDRFVNEVPWCWDHLEDLTVKEFITAKAGVPHQEPPPWLRIQAPGRIR